MSKRTWFFGFLLVLCSLITICISSSSYAVLGFPTKTTRPPKISCGTTISAVFQFSTIVLSSTDPITSAACEGMSPSRIIYGEIEIYKDGFTLDCNGNILSLNPENEGISTGIYIDANNVTIKNCVFDGYDTGIKIAEGRNIVINGNEIIQRPPPRSYFATYAMHISSATAPRIVNNTISYVSQGITLEGYGSLITNNYFVLSNPGYPCAYPLIVEGSDNIAWRNDFISPLPYHPRHDYDPDPLEVCNPDESTGIGNYYDPTFSPDERWILRPCRASSTPFTDGGTVKVRVPSPVR